MSLSSKGKLSIASKVFWGLLMSVGAFIVVHIFLQYLNLLVFHERNGFVFELSNRMDFDDEISIPTWFSMILLTVFGMLAFLAAYMQSDKKQRKAWSVIGFLGILLSIDEGASIHEFLLQSTHNIFFLNSSPTSLHNAWWVLLPLILFFGIGILVYLIRHLPKPTMLIFIAASILFVFGAAIVDAITTGFAKNTFLFQGIYVSIEELFELVGIIALIYAVVDYLELNHSKQISLALKQMRPKNKNLIQ